MSNQFLVVLENNKVAVLLAGEEHSNSFAEQIAEHACIVGRQIVQVCSMAYAELLDIAVQYLDAAQEIWSGVVTDRFNTLYPAPI